MNRVVVQLDPNAALFSNPNSEEAKLQNLMLNMMGGLKFEDCSQDEKDLLIKNGYEPEKTIQPKIEWDVQVDRYDNKVSIITASSGRQYRMVGHSKPFHQSKRYTIYAGRNKFIRAKIYSPQNDCVAAGCMVGNYNVSWGDGDVLAVVNDPLGPNLQEKLKAIHSDNSDAVIITVLDAIENLPKMWMSKF